MANLSQTVLPFKLEKVDSQAELTGLAGLPLIHELFRKLGLPKLIRKYVRVKEAGYLEADLIEHLVALVVAGGEHLEDIERFQSDEAFGNLVDRKDIPCAKTFERLLKRFHEEQERPSGEDAWVPEESKALKGLAEVNRQVVRKLIDLSKCKVVTLENDATVIESFKQNAWPTYKGGTGYQPTLGVVAELGLIVADEFRDGNVPAAFQVKSFFEKCLPALPSTVKAICFRGDGAYYEHELMDHLKEKGIPFTVTAKKSASILDWIEARPETDWKDLYETLPTGELRKTSRQYLEITWTSAQGSQQDMRDRKLRYLVTRKTQEQWELFQQNHTQEEILRKERYEVIATNLELPGDRVIAWHYQRAGSIEQVHDRVKNDLAGNHLPCAEFGANAAWFRIQCLAWNLVRALQLYILPEDLKNVHLKRLRFCLFNLVGRVITHARALVLKIASPYFEIYQSARRKIAALEFG